MQSSPARSRPRGATGYFAAVGMAQLFALARYTVLARLLGPEQLGLAAILTVTSSFFDTVTDSGSDRFLIQDSAGDTEHVQRMVQLVYIGRGAVSAIGLVIVAAPVAAFYHAPTLVAALIWLAIAPMIAGFIHMDMRRSQRRHDFRTEGLGLLASEGVCLAATTLAAWLTHSFTAVIFGLICRAMAMVIVSHARAERPYRIGYAPADAGRLARFAAPLMLNGLLLFMGSQTDRVLVGARLGVAQLGHYSAIILLLYYPVASLTRFMTTIHLPRIAAHRDDPVERSRAADGLGGLTLLLSVAMTAGFAIVAPMAIVILFGRLFSQPLVTVTLIAILATSRLMRLWPVTIAMSLGETRIVLADNVARLISLPAALVGMMLIGGIPGVAAGFIAGELLAVATALTLVNRAMRNHLLHGFHRIAAFILASGLILAWSHEAARPSPLNLAVLAALSAALIGWIAKREWSTVVDALRWARSALGLLGRPRTL